MNDKAFIGVLVISVIGFIFIISSIRYSTTRDGEHTGYITAVQQGGIIFHNYTVYVKTDLSSSQEDTYCVGRNFTTLARDLKEYSKTKERVTVHYEGVRGFGMSLCIGEQIHSVTK